MEGLVFFMAEDDNAEMSGGVFRGRGCGWYLFTDAYHTSTTYKPTLSTFQPIPIVFN